MSRSFASEVASTRESSQSDDPPDEVSIELEEIAGRVESETDAAEIVIEDLPDDLFDEFVEALVGAALDAGGAANLSTEEWQIARTVMAGYVELLDRSLGRLMSALRERADRDSILFIVTAAEGVPAGERSMMSLLTTPLPEEVIHTPLIVQQPGAESGTRRQQLVQTVDLMPTLLDWFQIDAREVSCEGQSLLAPAKRPASGERDYICLGDGTSNCAIRTRERYLVQERTADNRPDVSPRLFVKPDDIWEINEVSAQSPAEVEALTATLEEFVLRSQNQVPVELPELRMPE
jgi:arylsulfatase A-like enzyme